MYVYKIIEIDTNKVVYVGQHKTNNIKDNYMGSGILLARAYNKYGVEKYKKEIIEFCDTTQTLNEKEEYWIDKLNTCVNGYNIAKGGTGGNNIVWTEEERKRNSDVLKERYKNPEEREKLRQSVLKFYNNRTQEWNDEFSRRIKAGIKEDRQSAEYRKRQADTATDFWHNRATEEFKKSSILKNKIARNKQIMLEKNGKRNYFVYTRVIEKLNQGWNFTSKYKKIFDMSNLTQEIINEYVENHLKQMIEQFNNDNKIE